MSVQYLTKVALEQGLILRNDRCQQCGECRRVVAHHDDYAKPLSIRWLCTKCHRKWHWDNGPGKNRDVSGMQPLGEPQKTRRTERPEKKKRREKMLLRRHEGWSDSQIGREFGVSRERVRQLLGNRLAYLRQRCAKYEGEIALMRSQRKSIDHIARVLALPRNRIKELPDLLPRPVAPIRHATITGYNRGCRCNQCREANAKRHSDYAIAKKADGFNGLKHGVRSTYHLGCKCESCLKVGREAQRVPRAK
jgi:ribosomal protein S27AE